MPLTQASAQHSSVATRVETILRRVRQAHYDDKLLVVTYWFTYDNIDEYLDDIKLSEDTKKEIVKRIAKGIIENATKPETITRIKRDVLSKHRRMSNEED